MRNSIISKAKKLKELAERGVGGEKENAKMMFDAYIKKHNITEEELTNGLNNLVDIPDEVFLREMIKEIFPNAIYTLFASIFSDNDNMKSDAKNKLGDSLIKYAQIINKRVDKIVKR